jgi:signal transduction histidine kinase
MRFFKSLRARLILLVLIAVIPAMGVTLYSGLEQRRLARNTAEEDVLRLARAMANYQASLVEGARQLSQAIVLMPAVRQEDPAACSQFLKSLNASYPMYASFSLASLDGKLYCASMPMTRAVNVADRSYFQQALQRNSLAIGEAVVGRLTGKMILPFALPLKDDKGSSRGIFIASLDLQSVFDMAKTIQLPQGSTMLLVNPDGTVLGRLQEADKWAGQNLSDVPLIHKIISEPGGGSVEIEGLDGVRRFYGFTPVKLIDDQHLTISIGIPTNLVFAEADRLLLRNLLWIGGIAVLALIAAWFGGDILFLRIVSLTAERDAAEKKLREMNEQLELRVIERTAELDYANTMLSTELEERQQAMIQLREREQELEKMLVIVERSNRELENFAYITSHDLQEPLRKIQAFGDRLSKRYTSQLGEEGVDFVQRMSSAANRLQVMIGDLLTYSRITTRAHEFALVDLNQAANEVLADLEVRIAETGGKVTFDKLPIIQADASQIRQLLMNLINNALKFHRPDIPPEVKISSEAIDMEIDGQPAPGILLYVEDNGIGFEEKYIDRIFQAFQRLHGHNVYEGSGIGLAICRKIVERHGGSITAESVPGSGSRFIVKLPVHSQILEGAPA